jgi:hypothetical protein
MQPDQARLRAEAEAEALAALPSGHPDTAKEHVSTALSTAAILAIVAGVGLGLWPHWGPWALCAAGALLAALVAWTDVMRQPPKPQPTAADAVPARRPLPGPESPGIMHVKGPGAE